MTGSLIPSSAALCHVTVSNDILQRDIVLAVVLGLASPFQLKVTKVDMKNNKSTAPLTMSIGNPLSRCMTHRNSIVRSIIGTALHGSLDLHPYYLMGGYFLQGHSVYGASHIAAINLGTIHSWMSIADEIRNKSNASDKEEYEGKVIRLLDEMNAHLNKSAFLIDSAICTIADLDMAVALSDTKNNSIGMANYPAVSRWKNQTLHVLKDYAETAGVIVPISCQPTPFVKKMPVFYSGTEDVNAILSSLYKDTKKLTKNVSTDPSTSSTASTSQKSDGGDKQNKQQQKQPKEKPAAAGEKVKNDPSPSAASKATEAPEYNISALDIRVGKIIKIWEHPEAEKLFCEEIDLGNGEIRSIASGLRPFYKAEDLLNRYVLVLCNLKSRALVGFASHGMVLCASNADHTAVEIVVPAGSPSEIVLGERITFANYPGEPEAENKMAKKKVFEKVAPELLTNDSGEVVWKDCLATTKAGIVCAINKMPNAKVS
jgi:aminoacyl tRNA synthase complex-interacting multifunctional protein 1